jgi:uncharacterized protein involved in exopolysaccharide biosynthesis
MPLYDTDSFDSIDYVQFVRERWKLPAIAILIAVIIAAAACLILPKQYTATASLVIEPPGTDQRSAIAVSPVYLESLRTYETFASGDALFAKAADRFHLLKGNEGTALETFKKRVLRVEKLKDTKVLQIRATLPDPNQSLELVRYLADETVALDRGIARSGDSEMLADAEQKLQAAQVRADNAQAGSAAAESSGSEAVLEKEASALAEVRARIESERTEANSLIAESEVRGDKNGAAEARARLNTLNRDLAALKSDLDSKSVRLGELHSKRQRAAQEVREAEAVLEAARKHEFEASNTVKSRTEQLHIIDPGVVPQRPSFPNLPLAVLSAVILSSAGSVLWLALQFGLSQKRERPGRSGLRVAGGVAR